MIRLLLLINIYLSETTLIRTSKLKEGSRTLKMNIFYFFKDIYIIM